MPNKYWTYRIAQDWFKYQSNRQSHHFDRLYSHGWATLFCLPFLSANGGQTIMLFAQTKLIRREQRAMPDYAEFLLPPGRNTLPLLQFMDFHFSAAFSKYFGDSPKKVSGIN